MLYNNFGINRPYQVGKCDYSEERIAIPPTIIASAIIFSIKVSRSNGSFSSCIFRKLKKLLTKNTKNGRVAAKAATNDIAPISVARVSDIDATGAIKKSAMSIKAKVRPLRSRDSISRKPFGFARIPKAMAIAAALIE